MPERSTLRAGIAANLGFRPIWSRSNPVRSLELHQGFRFSRHELRCTKRKPETCQPDRFPAIGHCPALHEIHERVRKKGRVNAEVLLASQMTAQRFEESRGKSDAASVLDEKPLVAN
jgi:hypothetical protein